MIYEKKIGEKIGAKIQTSKNFEFSRHDVYFDKIHFGVKIQIFQYKEGKIIFWRENSKF